MPRTEGMSNAENRSAEIARPALDPQNDLGQ
jgi:hypothetical protein